MLIGGCLCGGVRYQYDGEIEEISLCHCSMCRKAQGSAYAAVGPIARSRFRITAGESLLKAYRSAPGKQRVFCSHCGSPIFSARDDLPEVIRLRLGSVDSPIACRNAYHAFVDSKADWERICDDLPQYPGRKPVDGQR